MIFPESLPHQAHIERQIYSSRRIKAVVLLTLITFLVEIVAGYLTGSVALQADAWHMLTHVFALSLSLVGYALSLRITAVRDSPVRVRKMNALTGYTSGLVLSAIALGVVFESGLRLMLPQTVNFRDALVVAVIGFFVNLVCAWMLHYPETLPHDHNMRSAYLHVLADAFTSVTAMIALSLGWLWGWVWLDAVMGLVGSTVIAVWCVGLLRQASRELLALS